MTSIANRLKSAQPYARRANRGGCVTCQWWDTISEDTRTLINEWLDNNYSGRQLWEILTAPTDDGGDPQLEISLTGFRLHLNHHDEKCRGGD